MSFCVASIVSCFVGKFLDLTSFIASDISTGVCETTTGLTGSGVLVSITRGSGILTGSGFFSTFSKDSSIFGSGLSADNPENKVSRASIFLLSSTLGSSTITGLMSSTFSCKSSSTISGLISTPKDLISPENASNFCVSSFDKDFFSTGLDCSWTFPLGLLFFSILGVTFLGLMGVSSSFFSITFTTFCTDVRKLSSSFT